ncbi:MAG: hypothetical protein K9J12_03300 [Melioribacteraceae bacterium]|nr:hypothetical protein [Melioribacteraceae bacterium]MCF8414399.1 hypothetical protein [Melioribacteraceae bacterium]
MSHSRARVLTNLSGLDLNTLSREDLVKIFREILENGIHGIAYSAYFEGQAPGSQLDPEMIRKRIGIIKPYVKWLRTFSCTEGNELIPQIAYENGLKSMVGAWIGHDKEKNEKEIEGLMEVASKGYANILAVGNEVLLRGDLHEDEIIALMERVKEEFPSIPVAYVDAYYEFNVHPNIADACDIILTNCYPFWEGYPIEHAHLYMKEMYRRAAHAGKGKKVIISETGWPNRGSNVKGSVPSFENALKYFIDAYRWAAAEGVEIFYFSSFDETWKIAAEGDVGAYWGLWDKDGNLKYT